jgi:hypothetical protein
MKLGSSWLINDCVCVCVCVCVASVGANYDLSQILTLGQEQMLGLH